LTSKKRQKTNKDKNITTKEKKNYIYMFNSMLMNYTTAIGITLDLLLVYFFISRIIQLDLLVDETVLETGQGDFGEQRINQRQNGASDLELG